MRTQTVFLFVGLLLALTLVMATTAQPVESGDDTGPEIGLGIEGILRITSDPADQERPSIAEDRIVWQDKRNWNWDIYYYDLSSEEEVLATNVSHDETDPEISGDIILFADRAGSGGDPAGP